MDGKEVNVIELSLAAQLEALLFAAPGPVTAAQLAQVLDVSTPDVEKGLEDLAAEYEQFPQNRGLRLQRHRDRYQLTSAPESAGWIERLLGLGAGGKLTRASLETLAIVAYQQPVTRPQVDAIRGVNSDAVLKNLLSKGLVTEVGRAEVPGRPYLYCITPEFLQYFGLNAVDELPPLAQENSA